MIRPKTRKIKTIRAPRLDEYETPQVCIKCDNTWFPRIKNPRQCPSCKSTHWNPKSPKLTIKNDYNP